MGDAFGERFFGNPGVMWARIVGRVLPDSPWLWTDDTAMARVIVGVLREHQELPPKVLAQQFAFEYERDPGRGYGRGAAEVLSQVSHGVSWETASSLAFGGVGSFGNGAAMRAAPVGAYFAGDPAVVIEQATIASKVTHFHPDGIAGGIAVALAACWAAQQGEGAGLLGFVQENLPAGQLRRAIRRAGEIPFETKPSEVAAELGNGSDVTALDTVPFCLWLAAAHLDDFQEAMWATVGVLGDRDTTCAIVGGIIASHPATSIPKQWLAARESLV